MPRPREIPAATEYTLHSAHEMEEMLDCIGNNYEDIGFFECDTFPVGTLVENTAQIFAMRSPGERELAAAGVL